MPFVIAAPELMASAALDLAGIRSTVSETSAPAAAPTTAVMTAAGDEVSVAIASLFSTYGQAYQSLSVQAGTFHQDFVQALNRAGLSFADAEVATASPLQAVEHDALSAI